MYKIKHLFALTWSLIIYLGIHPGTCISQCFNCKNAPKGTIWCDDFEDTVSVRQKYFEYNDNQGDFIKLDKIGRDLSHGMRVKWQQGEISAGSLSKSFGKTPDTYIGKYAAHPTAQFDEIYWRMDVMAQSGWTGSGPAKLSRALCLANSNWAEGMMAHLWSGGNKNEFLGMDPASGIGTDGQLKSTKYNDFNNLRWLGFKSGTIDLFSTKNAGRWFCVVGHVKLNTPGQKNGIFEFWINDTLQASSTTLDWHSTWNNNPANMHINAVFFENYWNAGSPVEQERYFDNLVISTQSIPCKCEVTHVGNVSMERQLLFYPNPSSTFLKLDPSVQLPIPIEIYDLNGKRHSKEMIYHYNQHIDISKLSSGIYLLKSPNFQPYKMVVSHVNE